VETATASAELTKALADPDDNEAQILWRQAEARVLVARGKLDEARELAEAAVELTADTVDLVLRADALIDLAMVLIWAGRRNEAGPPVREALELYERKGASVAAERTRLLLDEVAVAS
jgi:tetratricopeptide (TPR) repeat protein